jgi:hypothetical protein
MFDVLRNRSRIPGLSEHVMDEYNHFILSQSDNIFGTDQSLRYLEVTTFQVTYNS